VCLTAEHDRQVFSCGEPSLDDYLRRRAGQDERRLASIAYVLIDPAVPRSIVGYYTLSNLSVEAASLPLDVAKQLPRYPDVPGVLIGRLAVDERFRGRGLGAALLADAFDRALALSEHSGCALVVVDALNDRAAAFYRHHGFRPFPNRPERLFVSLRTLRSGERSASSQ
jgi:GNAT superfamily N-acetyltransferase